MKATDPETSSAIFGIDAAAREPRVPAARLGVVVVRDIVESIVTGRIEPGDTLPPEGPLSVGFGVSRTVIRESIKRVEEKGLVQVEQGRGTTVMPQTSWNLLDPVVLAAMIEHDDSLGILDEVVTVRASLESDLAGVAAETATSLDIERLAEALQGMRDHLDQPGEFDAGDIAFHGIIMTMSSSRLGASIARVLVGEAMASDRYNGKVGRPGFLHTLREHQRIFDAVAAHDADEARLAMRRHIEDAWRRRKPGAQAD